MINVAISCDICNNTNSIYEYMNIYKYLYIYIYMCRLKVEYEQDLYCFGRLHFDFVDVKKEQRHCCVDLVPLFFSVFLRFLRYAALEHICYFSVPC